MKRVKYMLQTYKNKWLLLAGGALLLGGLFMGRQFGRAEPEEKSETTHLVEMSQSTYSTEDTNEVSKTEKAKIGYVDIKGAVKKPGMYQVEENMRLIDVVEKAGGFIESADKNRINYAKLVEDQMTIYIPKEGEELKEEELVQEEDSTTGDDKKDSEKININKADATELQRLNGVGEKKAAEIIRYREEQGSFKEVTDLTKVKGIGEKTFESLKELITIK